MGNKWALVTGAGRGIGAEIAKALARDGVHLYLHYFRSREGVREVAAYCESRGVEALVCRADLRNHEEIAALFKELPRMPDILVNNAGCDHYAPVADVTPADWEKVMNLNVRSAFFCAQHVLPSMIRRRYGRIINISSVWGICGASGEVLYSLSKGALNAFTKALAKEVAPHNITVNAVAPGAVETDMLKGFAPHELEVIKASIPLGRFGKVEEIASLVSYLASDAAGYLTGQIISPNGGWVI
ncbi:SDR family oxidoreductase [Bacillaceae bacterium]